MPQDWARKTEHGQWSQADLNAALSKFRANELSKREACRTYNIGRATLDRYLATSNEGEEALKVSRPYSTTSRPPLGGGPYLPDSNGPYLPGYT